MCIICCKPMGKDMPSEEIMKNMWVNNPDGAGFMYVKDHKVVIEKGFMEFEVFKAALEKVKKKVDLKKTAVVLHFRIGTHGGNTAGNTHPFPISDSVGILKKLKYTTNVGVAHNGIISITPRRKDISDTMEYIASQLAPLQKAVKEFYKDANLMTMIENAISSKMAFLDGDGGIYTIGHFEENNGLLYSNSSYDYGYKKAFGGSWAKYWDSDIIDDWKDNYEWDDMITLPLMMLEEGDYIICSDSGEWYDADCGAFFIDEEGDCYEFSETEGACVLMGNCTAYAKGGKLLEFDKDAAEVMDVLM